MEIIKGYGKFLILVIVNIGMIGFTIAGICAVKHWRGWEGVFGTILLLVSIVATGATIYFTGGFINELWEEIDGQREDTC